MTRPSMYRIPIQGHLADRWANWFDGLRLTREAQGDTLLIGPVTDRAALHGPLTKIRDLGLPLIAVNRIEPEADS